MMKNVNIFSRSYFSSNTVDSGYVDDNHSINRVYRQYRNKTKVSAWFEICKKMGDPIYQTSSFLRKSYNVTNVSGELLNIIGRIVVLPREFIAPVGLTPPMCATALNSPWEVGASDQQLSGLSTDSDVKMSDEIYRLGLTSKIIKNNYNATFEDILNAVTVMLPKANVLRIIDNEDMSFSIQYNGEITDIQSYVLSWSPLLPKPQGVKFNGFIKVRD